MNYPNLSKKTKKSLAFEKTSLHNHILTCSCSGKYAAINQKRQKKVRLCKCYSKFLCLFLQSQLTSAKLFGKNCVNPNCGILAETDPQGTESNLVISVRIDVTGII